MESNSGGIASYNAKNLYLAMPPIYRSLGKIHGQKYHRQYGNIREKKIRGKKFSSKQATDENFLTPNIS